MINRKSNIEGMGLFADRDIAKGEEVYQFTGPIISVDEAEEIYNAGCDFLLQVDQYMFLDLRDCPGRRTNHSCSPNTAFTAFCDTLIALKDIKKGDEITFDYSANENTEFVMDCKCGSANCRGIILPWHGLSDATREKLKPITSNHIKHMNLSQSQNNNARSRH